MFPIDPLTLFLLSLIFVFLSSALAVKLNFRWRIALTFISFILPAAQLYLIPISGDLGILPHIVAFIAICAASMIGIAVGSMSRVIRQERLRALYSPMIVSLSAFFAIWLAYGQYVPDACLGKPLQVRIDGQIISIPPEMQPRIETRFGFLPSFFGQMDHKVDYARLCRIGRNGTQAVDVDEVWVTPAATYKRMAGDLRRARSTDMVRSLLARTPPPHG